MSDATGRRLVLTMWLASFLVIGWENWSKSKTGGATTLLPPPSQLVKASAAFTILSFLAEFAAPVAGILAVGLTVAVAENTFNIVSTATSSAAAPGASGVQDIGSEISKAAQAAGAATIGAVTSGALTPQQKGTS